MQFAELCGIVGIGHAAGAQAVAEAKRYVVSLHDFADFVEMGVEEVFLMMRQTPFRHNRTAARHDAGDALGGKRYITQQHAGMDGEIVHALLGLLNQGIAEQRPR